MTLIDATDPIAATPTHATDSAAAPSFWREVEKGFWVGNGGGEFLGTVEVHDGRFFARNRVMGYVGEYRTLEAAKCAISELTR